jgi:hypothetical protein
VRHLCSALRVAAKRTGICKEKLTLFVPGLHKSRANGQEHESFPSELSGVLRVHHIHSGLGRRVRRSSRVTAVYDKVDISREARDGHDLLRESLLEKGEKGVYEQNSSNDVCPKL